MPEYIQFVVQYFYTQVYTKYSTFRGWYDLLKQALVIAYVKCFDNCFHTHFVAERTYKESFLVLAHVLYVHVYS